MLEVLRAQMPNNEWEKPSMTQEKQESSYDFRLFDAVTRSPLFLPGYSMHKNVVPRYHSIACNTFNFLFVLTCAALLSALLLVLLNVGQDTFPTVRCVISTSHVSPIENSRQRSETSLEEVEQNSTSPPVAAVRSYSSLSSPSSSVTLSYWIQQRQWYYVASFLAGWAGGLASLLVVPVDTLKCRIQVGDFGSLQEGFRHVWKYEAKSSLCAALPILFTGWVPTMIGSTAHASIRLLLYDFFKSIWLPDPVQDAWQQELLEQTKMCAAAGGVASSSSPPPFSRWKRMRTFLFAAAVSEMIAVVLLIPWETLKVYMQTSSVLATHTDEKDSRGNQFSSLSAAAHSMRTHRGGFFSFYRGVPWLWLRQVPYTIAKFFLFELISGWVSSCYVFLFFHPTNEGMRGGEGVRDSRFETMIDKGEAITHVTIPPFAQLCISIIAGSTAGMVSAIVSHPADTLLSRKTSKGTSTSHAGTFPSSHSSSFPTVVYANKNDRLRSSVSWQGIRIAFKNFLQTWKGLGPRMVMIGFLSGLQWAIYSMVKTMCGFPLSANVKKVT